MWRGSKVEKQNKIMLKIEKGFTLIEVLIVVAIIGILASVVLVGLGPTQRAGRDARRISDLRQTQNALELYFNKCGYYPGTVQANPPPCGAYAANNTWGDAVSGMTQALIGSAIGVSQIPNDPTSGKTYYYGANAVGSSYVVGAKLEDSGNQALSQDIDGTVNGVDCADPVYCVQL